MILSCHGLTTGGLFTLMPDINADLRWLLSKADFIGPAAEASDLSAVIHVNGRFLFRLFEFPTP